MVVVHVLERLSGSTEPREVLAWCCGRFGSGCWRRARWQGRSSRRCCGGSRSRQGAHFWWWRGCWSFSGWHRCEGISGQCGCCVLALCGGDLHFLDDSSAGGRGFCAPSAGPGRSYGKPLPAATTPHQRVVWLLFDEMSYDQVFVHRFPGLELPNLDKLRGESVDFLRRGAGRVFYGGCDPVDFSRGAH